MNMNKVWFYIAALAVVIAGVWLMRRDIADKAIRRQAD